MLVHRSSGDRPKFDDFKGMMHIGKRLSFSGDLCTVRYIGEVKGTKGEWLGVEWDDASRGKHNGEAGGVKYFECRNKSPTAASFIRPQRPADTPRTFLEALRYKYATEDTNTTERNQRSLATEAIRISGKKVEEVGFEKVRKQLAELHELRVVLLDGLCVRQPLHEDKSRSFGSGYVSPNQPAESKNIHDVCPQIVDLDLSRNLFEHWGEVVSICEQLHNLRSLRAGGNRFNGFTFSDEERKHFQSVFNKVKFLGLDNILLDWGSMVDIMSLFRDIQSIALSNNHLFALDSAVTLDMLPQRIVSIDLGFNQFHSIADVSPLATLPALQTLILKNNFISAVTVPTSTAPLIFNKNLSTVDLSHNAIDTWTFVHFLKKTFPGLKALRIAHNPLFTHLVGPDHRTLSTEGGYMLTIGRLPNLTSLNYSTISPKDRLNAESYYLSLITLELSLSPETEARNIKAKHPEWERLCKEYGEPEVERLTSQLVRNSLAARLLKLRFRLGDSAFAAMSLDTNAEARSSIFEIEVPRTFSIYSCMGVAGKHFALPAMRLKLVYETAEWDILETDDGHADSGYWNSDDDGDGDMELDIVNIGWSVRRARREVFILAGTRGIGSWVDGSQATITLEMSDRNEGKARK